MEGETQLQGERQGKLSSCEFQFEGDDQNDQEYAACYCRSNIRLKGFQQQHRGKGKG